MPRSFLLWKEVKTNSFNPNEASTRQPTLGESKNENPHFSFLAISSPSLDFDPLSHGEKYVVFARAIRLEGAHRAGIDRRRLRHQGAISSTYRG
jgi:hypothetical protein